MTQTYRTDDGLRWGTGKGSNLTPTEVDINFWDIIQRILALEALPDPAAGIVSFETSGTDFYVHMSDDTVLGPYTLPVAMYNNTGDWLPSFSYSRLDTFTQGGGLYAVNIAHISDTTFDPGANNGVDDYYSLLLQTPGSSLPTGGATGQSLQKSTSADFAVTWGWKLPTGGTARQYLIKINSTQDNAAWGTPQAEDIDFTPATGSVLSSTNVADAIEEAASLAGGNPDAIDIVYTPPTGSSLSASNVQDAIDELANETSAGAEGSFVTTPTGNVSTTEKAMGLGSTFTFTPNKTGILVVFIAGMVLNSSGAGDGVTITGRYGIGTPPANGDTSGLGTGFATPQHFVCSTVAGQQGFMVMGKVTGLTPGALYWFDLSIVAVTAGGATVKDVQYVAVEVGL